MTQQDIYYTNIIRLLKEITDHADTESYYDALPDEIKKKEFASIVISSLQSEINILEQNFASSNLYGRYEDLKNVIDTISISFPDFNIQRKQEILLIIYLHAAISNQVGDLTNRSPIAVVDFDLVKVDTVWNSVRLSYYYYHNAISFSDSYLLFSLNNLDDFENALTSTSTALNLTLLFVLLSKIGVAGDTLDGNYYVLTKHGDTKLNRIKSTLLLQAVSDGHYFHTPHLYSQAPHNDWRTSIKSENKYQQFLDTIYILSEYNYYKDIINKYLKLYQIIENFMYKSALVKLEKINGGRLFSIRDFKRMYENISDREYNTLLVLIEEVLDMNFNPATKFKVEIFNQFASLVPQLLTEAKMNGILKVFNIKNKAGTYAYSRINSTNIHGVFSQFIYNIRNSIVHNKTTEFHLSYNTLNGDIAVFLERFMLPNLETIIFYLTTESAVDTVRFTSENLSLWADD